MNNWKRSIIILSVFVGGCSTLANEHQNSQKQIAYIGELKSFNFEDFGNIIQTPGSDKIIITNACGKTKTVLKVLASTSKIKPTQTVKRQLGEWCQSKFDWSPIRQWLVIVNAADMSLAGVFPVDFEHAIADFPLDQDEDLSNEMKSRFLTEVLEKPFPYPYVVNLANPNRRKDYSDNEFFEIRENEIFVVKAINLKKVFGDDW